MEKYINILKRTQLFSGVQEAEISAMLNCLQAKSVVFKKGEYVLRQGEFIDHISVLVEGRLHVQHDDFWGNRSILNVIQVGDMFGEAYVSPGSGPILNDVVAEEHSIVICFNVKKVLTTCSNACRFHSLVVQNLFFALSDKNRTLVQKIGHMSKRSTRSKLLSYLSSEAQKHNSNQFTIPFSRQQLADFLCVDRSAMSNELCKMRDDGLLIFNKNDFILL